MALIRINTVIQAPVERVFDLCRSIDLHKNSTGDTGERAVAGVTSGLIGLGEEVTWEARHFWVRQRLTVRITGFERANYFEDVMLRGAFREMRHRHDFEARGEAVTHMTDHFHFRAPLGLLGTLAEFIFLKSYMRKFLLERNRVIKQVAESDEWQKFLG